MTYAVITGAPGAGKSRTVKELLKLESEFVVFDLDWLHESAGDLARTSIYTDASTWPAYSKLWLGVLRSVAKNGAKPVLFCPLDKSDVAEWPLVKWLLLDCDDAEREHRLLQRGWDETRIQEASEDARLLRLESEAFIRTDDKTPAKVAEAVLEWLRAT